MMQAHTTAPESRAKSLPSIPRWMIGRLFLVAIALMLAILSGCARCRLPAVDPTGAHLFAPLPTTTTLALPGSAGEGCFGCLHDKVKSHHERWKLHHWSWPKCKFPKPAFPNPADPPKCAVPAPGAAPIVAPVDTSEPYIPSAPCNGQCKDGPPAVLYGKECESPKRPAKHSLHAAHARLKQHVFGKHQLPKRGKRGCILLTPQKIVAPVGGEVILLSGICGTDGYLQMGESLEWMLTPDSVGTFIQVGDDAPGFAHRLTGIKKAEKQDPSYARGVTSTKRLLITRGNLDPKDDVQLEKGQTWISISSPTEGTSHVTVLAPESECWDNRKATATIYWIDARWQFPGPQIVPAGTAASLTTRVTRAEGTLPAKGWKVRYEILQPDLATFAGTNGSSFVEVLVDDGGNATAELIPNPGTSGMATIDMQVIRPGGVEDNMPTMALARGQTFVTWSAPQLAIRAGAPEVATFNVPVDVAVNVSNPGDQAVNNVRVTMQIPPGAGAVSRDAFAQNLPSAIVWEIGTIPPQQQLDLFAQVTAQAPTQLTFTARGDGGLVAEDTVRIDVFRPSLSLTVEPVEGTYEAGKPVTFNVDVKNTGDRPLQNVNLVATGGELMIESESGNRSVRKPKSDGPLRPGQDWLVAATFTPTESGRRCITVEATADGGQRATAESCVTVINPVPPTPALTTTISGVKTRRVGDVMMIRTRVANTGQVTLTNTRATMAFDPQLTPRQATREGGLVAQLDDSRLGQYLLVWTLASLEPGQVAVLEAEFVASQAIPRSQVVVTAQSAEGANSQDAFTFEILPPATLAPSTDDDLPALPPVQPTPSIPGGPAPIPAPQPGTGQAAPPPTAPVRSERLQLSLIARDPVARVNQPIRYRLVAFNDSSAIDGQVAMRFRLPDGVSVSRVVPRGSPELQQLDDVDGVVYLPDIRTMRPGESVDYELVLISNQPQTFDLTVEAVSQRTPGGIAATAKTRVIP